MSASPTSPDHGLTRLVEEGYHVSLLGGCFLVRDVPYVTRDRSVARGTLVVIVRYERGSPAAPGGHQASWSGGVPCSASGVPLPQLLHEDIGRELAGIRTQHMFCAKPVGREYRDYHELVTSYVAILGGPVTLLDPRATARNGRSSHASRSGSAAQRYADTGAIRAGTYALARGIAADVVGVIGVGGTGSWILDLVSKTPVAAIHLYDDDVFEQHTAFRSPGAAPLSAAAEAPAKVDLLARLYGAMHRGIVPHRMRIDAATAPMLDILTFAFVCVDTAGARPAIVGRLLERGIPFVDVGMGLHLRPGGVGGIVRTTFVPAGEAAAVDGRVPLEGEADDPYSTNIQTAELNALNATLAVIEWKRARGFYPGGGGGAAGSLFTVDPPALHPFPASGGAGIPREGADLVERRGDEG